MDGEELTEQETALYDRQIRVWGVDAQRRLSKSHILVTGISGTIVEFCKNIVLAGVGSVTLMDDCMVTEESMWANFLITPDENMWDGNLSTFDGEFYDKFSAVVVGRCSLATKKRINEICRKRPNRIAFYTVDCRDSCGEIFVDLHNYSYAQKKLEETVECRLQYSSFEEAVAVPWKSLPRRASKLYFAMRVIEKFEHDEGRTPGETSIADLPNVLKLKKLLCEEQSVNESQIPDSLLERLLVGNIEHPPVCAIIGGILGQEVIKMVSGKGDPIKNFFFYDVMDGKGIIEDVSAPESS
ncbi:hypothetical protein C5167_007062 [Papaver somniferum]|uniref:THIF-type NAD/FAD binding fold domain-containing protein n=1 Tax=Papaver somniferum TaxID=3469 RepID=A0A4Y7JII5_PAPSO|nr:hypothetical protein C5167_007062 [Papaver somniferum]